MHSTFKQAVLILAHGNIEQLIALCKKLHNHFYVYVHYDAKNYPNVPISVKQELEALPNVIVFSKYVVNWGAFSIVKATIFLLIEALKNQEINYFHLISGQDWLTKPAEVIYDFFDGATKIYMTYSLANTVVKTYENVLLWQKLYYPYDFVKRNTLFGKIFHRISMLTQIVFRVNKLRKYKINYDIYCGSQWWSMPRNAVEYVKDVYLSDDSIVKVMKTGFCSDEMFFQTILCNSNLYKENVVNNNYRYILWKKKNNSYPAILDKEDYNDIHKNNVFFMRKISFAISNELLAIIDV